MPQCQTCLLQVDLEATTCPSCGSVIPRVRRISIQERKIASVLFADVRQSLRLIRGRDPEEASEILDPIVDAMVQGTRLQGGTIVQIRGDGVHAVFGAPVSYEDHAERACAAALWMQGHMRLIAADARARWVADVAIRVGIHSGEILFRISHDGGSEMLEVTGDTVYLAARMEQTAVPGVIQISSATRRLAGTTIATRSIGLRRIKGLSERIETFELLSPVADHPPRSHQAAASVTPFINRATELAAMVAALERGGDGPGEAFIVSGEPGCGKSRLIQEAISRYAPSDATVLHGWCTADGSRTAYLPLQILFRQILAAEQSDGDLRQQVRRKLHQANSLPETELDRMALAIAALLDSEAARSADWRVLGSQGRRASIFAAIRALFAALCREGPVILIIEDVHWADRESVAVIHHILDELPARMTMLLNSRPMLTGAESIKHPKLVHIPLAPLSPTEGRELVTTLLGKSEHSDELIDLVTTRAGGNPFFAEEIITDLAEQGVIGGDRFDYRRRHVPPSGGVPMTVRAVLAARIDRLTIEEKNLLETASVIGRVFDCGLLTAILQQPAKLVNRLLLQLISSQFLESAGGADCGFRHALTHEATYLGIAIPRRRVLHQVVLAALALPRDQSMHEPVEELLHHAMQAQQWHEAARYARRAGAKSLGLSANRQARIFLTQGLNALGHLPEGQERDELAVDLLLDMREALFRLGMLPEVVSRLNEAEAIADRLEDRRRRGQIIVNLSHIHWLIGDYDAANKVTDRAVAFVREWRDEALGVRSQFQLGLIQFARGEFMLSAGSMQRVIGAINAAPELLGRYGLDKALEALANSYAARAYTDLGLWGQAEVAVAESRRIADDLDRPFSRLFAEISACYLALQRGSPEAAMEAAEAAIWHCKEADASLMSPIALTLLGAAHLRGGSTAPALESLRQGVTSASGMRLLFNQPYRVALLAEAELRAGAADDALRLARRAIRLAARIGESAGEAFALRTAGLILAATGPSERAERYYRRALTLAERMQMQPLIECCRSELATSGSFVRAIC